MALSFIVFAGLLWGVQGAVHAQSAEVGVFEDFEVPPGAQFEVPVEVRGVTDLYAVDIELRFDPDILQAEDANPDVEGVQPALGTFLDAGLTLFNEVDNEEGLVRFAMSQVNPAEPKSGDGIVLVLYFVAQAEGESPLEISLLEGSDRFGDAIELEPVEAEVRVSAGTVQVAATAIPVQVQAGLIAVPTLAPTDIPTETPVPTATPMPEVETVEDDAYPGDDVYPGLVEEPMTVEEAYPAEETDATEDQHEGSILDYWWAVLIVVLLAVGLGAYFLLTRKRT